MEYWERFPCMWPGLGGPRLEKRVGNEIVQNWFGDGRGGKAGVKSANRESME